MTPEFREAFKRQRVLDKAQEEYSSTGKISEDTSKELEGFGVDVKQITSRFASLAIKSTATSAVIGVNRTPQSDLPVGPAKPASKS